jgi:hypothetical protein
VSTPSGGLFDKLLGLPHIIYIEREVRKNREYGFIRAGKVVRTGLVLIFVIGLMGSLLFSPFAFGQSKAPPLEPEKVLMAIYKEVLELGYRDQEDFLKREFHFNLDGSMANREEHILVLSHTYGNGEKMILQVTYFGENARGGAVRTPTLTREISCLIEGNAIEIQESMFELDESLKLFPEILKGIQDEKKFLKRIK